MFICFGQTSELKDNKIVNWFSDTCVTGCPKLKQVDQIWGHFNYWLILMV